MVDLVPEWMRVKVDMATARWFALWSVAMVCMFFDVGSLVILSYLLAYTVSVFWIGLLFVSIPLSLWKLGVFDQVADEWNIVRPEPAF